MLNRTQKDKSKTWIGFGIYRLLLFCEAEEKIPPIIGMLRNIQTFYIKWIFDSLFVRFKMAPFTWAWPFECKIPG